MSYLTKLPAKQEEEEGQGGRRRGRRDGEAEERDRCVRCKPLQVSHGAEIRRGAGTVMGEKRGWGWWRELYKQSIDVGVFMCE